MEPTASSGKVRPGQTEFAFVPREQAEAGPTTGDLHCGEAVCPLAANSQPVAGASGEVGASLSAADDNRNSPRWLQRLQKVVFVLLCIPLGLLLVVLPWYLWNMNVLLADYPLARAILQSYFVRGLVTGLGIIDIWLGISEAVRDPEGTPEKDTSNC